MYMGTLKKYSSKCGSISEMELDAHSQVHKHVAAALDVVQKGPDSIFDVCQIAFTEGFLASLDLPPFSSESSQTIRVKNLSTECTIEFLGSPDAFPPNPYQNGRPSHFESSRSFTE